MKVIKSLKKDFKTIDDAEEAYNIDYFGMEEWIERADSPTPESPCVKDIFDYISCNLGRLTSSQRVQLTSQMYSFVAENDFQEELKHFIPKNFIELSLHAARNLKNDDKDNVIFNLCKCLGVMREDGSTTRMDMQKMPFGLISYNCKFFASEDSSNLHVPNDYMQWMESMYTYFGNSWASLHLGPMWSFTDVDEEKKSFDTSNIIEEALSSVFNEMTIPECPVTPLANVEVTSDILETHVATSSSITCATTINSTMAVPENEGPFQSTPLSVINPSTLWSGLSEKEKEELLDVETSPFEIGEMFNVQPKPQNKVSTRRNTMDVSLYLTKCSLINTCTCS